MKNKLLYLTIAASVITILAQAPIALENFKAFMRKDDVEK
jgi:hypothetical protein